MIPYCFHHHLLSRCWKGNGIRECRHTTLPRWCIISHSCSYLVV